MNRRKLAIQIIVAEVAQEGKAGRCAIRAYLDTRMSFQTFSEAIRVGMRIYERAQNTPGAHKAIHGTAFEGTSPGLAPIHEREEQTMQEIYWVFVKGEETPRNVTPFSKGTAQWYADTLAIELGEEVRVFRHARTKTLGRLLSTHLPREEV